MYNIFFILLLMLIMTIFYYHFNKIQKTYIVGLFDDDIQCNKAYNRNKMEEQKNLSFLQKTYTNNSSRISVALMNTFSDFCLTLALFLFLPYSGLTCRSASSFPFQKRFFCFFKKATSRIFFS